MAEATAPVKSIENINTNKELTNEDTTDTTGYEFDMVNPLPADFKCVFCHGIVRKANSPPCHHIYCYTCLSKWEDQQIEMKRKEKDFDEKEEVEFECGQCRRRYRKTDVMEQIVVDRAITGSFKAKCKQEPLGCKWQGFISEYFESHINNCEYIVIGCKFAGCSETYQRQHEIKHLEICDHRLVPCQYCTEEQHHLQMEEHHLLCPCFPVKCVNEDCDVLVERSNMTTHLSNDCLEVSVNCSYNEIGCDFKCKRKDLLSHEQSFSYGHNKLLFGHLNRKSIQNDLNFERLQSELEQTRDKLDVTERTLDDTNQKLDETRKLYECACVDIDQLKQNNLDDVKRLEEKIAEMKPLNKDLHTKFDVRLQEQKKDLEERLNEQNINIVNKIEILAKVIKNKPRENVKLKSLQTIVDQIEHFPTKPLEEPPLVLHINDVIKYEFTLPPPPTPTLKDVMRQMKVGKLYWSQDERRIYFKLKIEKMKNRFYWQMHDDVKNLERIYKHNVTFANDKLLLLDFPTEYQLYIQINGWVKDNCWLDIYQVNKHPPTTKRMEQKLNDMTEWEDFLANGHMLILLQKK